jgi:hypothetical protein
MAAGALAVAVAFVTGVVLTARWAWDSSIETRLATYQLSVQLRRLHPAHDLRVDSCGEAGRDGGRTCVVHATAPSGQRVAFSYRWRRGLSHDPESTSLRFLYGLKLADAE